MNPNYKEFKFPTIRSVPWTSVFPPNTDVNALNLIASMLIYIPGNRCKAIEVRRLAMELFRLDYSFTLS